MLTDSGTSALTLALRHTCDDGRRPVAIPAYGCFDLATAVLGARVPFILYDVDPTTLGPDFDSLRRALRQGADRIVVVHLYGVPVDMRAVLDLARDHGALVIDDAAQGVGARFNGQVLGSIGDIGVLSFGRGKGLTSGRGGALLWNQNLETFGSNAVAGVEVGSRRWLGEALICTAQWSLGRPALFGIPSSIPMLHLGDTVFRPPHDIEAISAFATGVLQETIPLADTEGQIRKANAAALRATAEQCGLTLPKICLLAEPGYLRLPVIGSAMDARRARTAAAESLGIRLGYPSTLAELDGFGHARVNGTEHFAGADHLAARLFTLPVHSRVSTRDLLRLTGWCAASDHRHS